MLTQRKTKETHGTGVISILLISCLFLSIAAFLNAKLSGSILDATIAPSNSATKEYASFVEIDAVFQPGSRRILVSASKGLNLDNLQP
jgi:hypothetical protein